MEALRSGSSKVATVRQATLRLRALASRAEPITAQRVKPASVLSNGIVADKQFPLPGNVASQYTYNSAFDVPSLDLPLNTQVTAMECTDAILEKAQSLFPKQNLKGVSVVNFVQKTSCDMSEWSAKMEIEWTGLTSEFTQSALQTCDALRSMGYWADFINPSTGKAYLDENTTEASLNNTDEEYRSLGFEITDMGCCKVLSHPEFGKNVFVGTLFTNAPTEVLSNL